MDENQLDEQALKWKALFRGSILSTTINKHVSYVGVADRRAQGIITINTILVPLALAGIQNTVLQFGAVISIITALLSVTAAIFSLYPKRGSNLHKQSTIRFNPLHFSQIDCLSAEEYMAEMNKNLQDTSKLAELAAFDIYHLATVIVSPKFHWLKRSYFIFLIGNFLALLSIAFQIIITY
jgi:hypothetical protein